MDLGLTGAVCAACWLAHRCNSIQSDMVERRGPVAVLRALAVTFAALACLFSIAITVVIAIALSGSILGPGGGDFYIEGCTMILALLLLVEATIYAYHTQATNEFAIGRRLSRGPELSRALKPANR